MDVLYQTRIQKERFLDRLDDYAAARGKYIIDADLMKILPKSSIVMHPLPRVDEVRPPPAAVCEVLASGSALMPLALVVARLRMTGTQSI